VQNTVWIEIAILISKGKGGRIFMFWLTEEEFKDSMLQNATSEKAVVEEKVNLYERWNPK
jgi:hypothetical protein